MNRDPARQARLEELIALFREIGGYDPEGWAEWEVDRNSPQLAYFLFFRRVWRDVIGPWREPSDVIKRQGEREGPVRRACAAGADIADLAKIAAATAYDVAFDMLNLLDERCDPEGQPGFPGWRLVEADAEGKPTGRLLLGLHESLLAMDPLGLEGRDLWGELMPEDRRGQ